MTRIKSAENLSWRDYQEQLANEFGLAVVLVEGEDSSVVLASNNSSICEVLYNSKEFSGKCAKFCGRAVTDSHSAEAAIHSHCHAGLGYSATPLKIGERKFALITGRAFTTTGEYNLAAKRAVEGDWKKFAVEKLFSNVLFSSSRKDLEQIAARIEKLDDDELRAIESFLQRKGEQETGRSEIDLEAPVPEANVSPAPPEISTVSDDVEPASDEQINEWRSLFGTLLELRYQQACARLLKFVSERFELKDVAWLERIGNEFELVSARGTLKSLELKMAIPANDARLLEAFGRESSLEFRERAAKAIPRRRTIQLFPVVVGENVRGALIVGNGTLNVSVKKRLSRFTRSVASDLEILRLRRQIDRQSVLANAVKRFNESLKQADAEDFFPLMSQFCAELMRAERGSLLLFDEESNRFIVKATIGIEPAELEANGEKLGERVARRVWETSKAIVAHDLAAVGLSPASPRRNYKTDSFICYPIVAGKRRIGVFNVTDRVDRERYDSFDLELLDTFAPQLAVALDRLTFKQRAGKFEQLSITDTLTGLLNRRYLQARLSEEVKRSARQGYPMSFMMIDVDHFKEYNDDFSHPEGDKALQLVAEALTSTLRGADVAARYGGEEFSILLPQTTLSEAVTIAERIRKKVEETKFPRRKVTVSIGVATFTSKISTAEALISAADKALFDAKRDGRNLVRIFTQKKKIAHRVIR